MRRTTKNLVSGAVTAAVYAALTFISAAFGIAYGPVQFRISEALTVLPVFGPSAIWGLTLGCFISNIASFNAIDMVFGTAATLCAALLSYLFKNVRIFKLPLLSMIAPVIVNAVMVGAEISVFLYPSQASFSGFAIAALWVALGEVVTCVGLGGLLYTAVSKNTGLKNFFE